MNENIKKHVDILRAHMQSDAEYAAIIETQRKHLHKTITVPGIRQPEDTRDWWYVSEARLGRAAVVYALTGDEYLGEWIHYTALELVRESNDAWIGPFFRKRFTPLRGMLETGHLSSAVGLAMLFAPELFSAEDKEELSINLREKGIVPIEEWMKPFYNDPAHPRNNWLISEMSGLFIAACALGDIDLVRKYLPLFNDMHGDYNSDFYGEPAGYWAYSCHSFLKSHFILDWAFPELENEKPSPAVLLNPYMWKYYRKQGTFMLQNSDVICPRNFAFGDNAAKGGDTPDYILMFTSVYHKDAKVRALASAELEELFFGEGNIKNNASPELICLLPHRGREKVEESDFPVSAIFGDGFMLYKDAWKDPKIQIALKCGQIEAPRVVGHRHADHLSFQLAKDGIVILDDPSLCCYRTQTHKMATSAGWHSVPGFTTVGENPRLLEQEKMTAVNIAEDRHCRRVSAVLRDNAFAVIGEAAEIYPEEITSVRRTFAAAGENVLVIRDTYTATEPVSQIATFLGNNRRRGMKWVFGDNCARMTREGVGVHIAAMQNVALSMDYAAINDANDVYPDSPLQGREGSGYLVRMRTKAAAEAGQSIYVVFADREENLDKWSASMQDDTINICENGVLRYIFRLGEEISIEENGIDLLK